jgi:hypothetical protein
LNEIIRKYLPQFFDYQSIEVEISKRDDILQINNEQWKLLFDYLGATNLLVDCLKLAVVTDRTAIEDRLLLPPS